jgi:two-component system sensor histidine kinase VicK
MSAAPITPTPHSLEAENQALREELQQLRATQTALAMEQAKADTYEQSQVRFRTVFEQSPLGQKIIDANLTIRQANPAVVALLGLAGIDELVGRPILDFTHPDHRADWQHLQQSLWAHETPHFTLETCLVRKDGTTFWCRVTSVLFSDEEGELGYTTLEDISTRKAVELQLKRLYEAQETILHLVTHDLRAPIGHIQLLADLLQDQLTTAQLTPAQAPDRTQYLALIRQACATATKLLQDVLLLGALDAHPFTVQPTDLGALLTQRLVAHRLVAHDKGLTLELELPLQSVQANLNADAFGRVVDNLVSNAFKFTPAGGRVTVQVQEQVQAGRVQLRVQDTGIGIPEVLQATLFEKFSASARAGIGGEASTGLGLFITKQIVEQHRGNIWVESQEGAGTCFLVEL